MEELDAGVLALVLFISNGAVAALMLWDRGCSVSVTEDFSDEILSVKNIF